MAGKLLKYFKYLGSHNAIDDRKEGEMKFRMNEVGKEKEEMKFLTVDHLEHGLPTGGS